MLVKAKKGDQSLFSIFWLRFPQVKFPHKKFVFPIVENLIYATQRIFFLVQKLTNDDLSENSDGQKLSFYGGNLT